MPEQRTLTPASSVDELLSSYTAGDVFLSAAAGALHTTGAVAVSDDVRGPDSLLGDAGPEGLVVGAVPFDPRRPARFLLPRTVRHAPGPPKGRAPVLRRRPLPGEWKAAPVPAPGEHGAPVERAVPPTADGGGPDTAVPARGLRMDGTSPVDPATVLNNLLWWDPGAFVFAFDLPDPDGGTRTLLGTSPELLVSKRGDQVVSNPLTGSAPGSADPTRDYRSRERLRASAEDTREHAAVVDAVAESLKPYCRSLSVPRGPEMVRTATRWHLSTRVGGTLIDPDTPAHLLAMALYPAAVCGLPPQPASETIGGPEPFGRGFPTGAVGYSTARGDGDWVLTPGGAEVSPKRIDVFAGAGVTAGSDSRAGSAETADRTRKLLFALGVR
ncbi:chorismate-binding protein [Nocardiopsis deserti]|uniref:chorismate-binding protein n=1 Tax=Nocardiopsis deserti TaxID=2605988 RepID=UPI001239D80E|nr:chorismate-binding protein [Nocardiopsis deserti]